MRRYLFRYLMAHKNYLVNTAAMWAAACVLPVLLGQIEARFILPIGFAILSLNTPLCILLEWYRPIRGWEIESDLWHHPRKYVVPAIMLLLAGLAGVF